jgi:hypothetical protein
MFNTCSWGTTHWSLTDTGEGYNLRGVSFSHTTPRPSQLMIFNFHLRASPGLQFNQILPTKPKFEFKESMITTWSYYHSTIYHNLNITSARPLRWAHHHPTTSSRYLWTWLPPWLHLIRPGIGRRATVRRWGLKYSALTLGRKAWVGRATSKSAGLSPCSGSLVEQWSFSFILPFIQI